MSHLEVKCIYFKDDGEIPNNVQLPVILYSGALRGKEHQAESIFNQNIWLNSWTNGVFDFHHYHSNAHEVLGVIRGSATLQLGGKLGEKCEVKSGDVILLPAGTGHKRLHASSDFKVVGAYPNGMDYNLRRASPRERLIAIEEIKRVAIPEQDPIYGEAGPLLIYWKFNLNN